MTPTIIERRCNQVGSRGRAEMSDNEEFERTRDFVRSKRRPVRRTAGPRSGSFITSPATRRGQDPGATDDGEPPAARGRPAPRRECLSHVAGYPVLAVVAGYLPQTAEHSSAAVSVCRAFRDVALPMLRAERRLWRLRRKSFCVQADLTAALLLSAEAVRAVPHREQRDRAGKVRNFLPAPPRCARRRGRPRRARRQASATEGEGRGEAGPCL